MTKHCTNRCFQDKAGIVEFAQKLKTDLDQYLLCWRNKVQLDKATLILSPLMIQINGLPRNDGRLEWPKSTSSNIHGGARLVTD